MQWNTAAETLKDFCLAHYRAGLRASGADNERSREAYLNDFPDGDILPLIIPYDNLPIDEVGFCFYYMACRHFVSFTIRKGYKFRGLGGIYNAYRSDFPETRLSNLASTARVYYIRKPLDELIIENQKKQITSDGIEFAESMVGETSLLAAS